MISIRYIVLTCVLSLLMISACSKRPNPPKVKDSDRGAVVNNNKPVKKKTGRPSVPSMESISISDPGNKNVRLSPQDIFAKCSPAVFMIYTYNYGQQFQGSGFFVNSKGLAVSNYHVFEGTNIGAEIISLQDGRRYKLKEVIYVDKENDIIVFTINSPNETFKYLPIVTRDIKVGDKVYAIGSPRGLENTFSSGEISQLRSGGIIQISVPIDHGSSGGALINEYGEVIGITSAGLDDSGANLNFAVTVDYIRNHIR